MKSNTDRGIHRLFFTADGDLDFGWAILVACCVVGLGAFVLSGFEYFKAPPWAWAWFGSFTTFAFIAGAAIGRARLIANSKTPGEVAQGIAQSAVSFTPHEWKDGDEPGVL